MTKRATIKDVARAANVSVATVSYIVNNTPSKPISEETRRRVLSAVQQLQYVPNTSAQRLKANRARCIAVRLSHTLIMPRYYSMLQGIRSVLTGCGYSILMPGYDEKGSLTECMDACMSGLADGLLYISANGIGIFPEEMDRLRERHIPVSVVDCMGSVPEVSSVIYDYYSSSRVRMDVLLRSGYRKFVYFRPLYKNYKESAREMGVRSVLMERDDVELDVRHLHTLDDDWLRRWKDDGQEGETYSGSPNPRLIQEVQENMADLPADTAVICYGREVQDMVSHILFAQSLRHPGPETAGWHKRSVSYHFPHDEVGREAARALVNMLDGDKTPRKASIHPILDFVDPDLFC